MSRSNQSSRKAPEDAGVYLGLGSNKGNRLALMRRAVQTLRTRIPVLELSSVYETEPLYVTSQAPFLNAVIEVAFAGEPEELLKICNRVEQELGRNRTQEQPKGPRNIDIDLLFFRDTVSESQHLTIPHPGILERAFVLRPLLEIAPNLVDPRTGTALTAAICIDLEQGIYRRDEILV